MASTSSSDTAMIPLDQALESSVINVSFNCEFNIPDLQKKYRRRSFVRTESVSNASKLIGGDVYVRFYPNGDAESPTGYCAVYVYIGRRENRQRFYVGYSFSIVDTATGLNEDVKEPVFQLMDRKRDFFLHGHSDFLNLMGPGKLNNQMLTLEVKLEVFTIGTYERSQHYPPYCAKLPGSMVKAVKQFDKQCFSDDEEVACVTLNGKKQKQTFKASKVILSNASTVLEDQLHDPNKNSELLKMKDYSAETVQKFLSGLHRGTLVNCNTWSDSLNMFSIASAYKVKWMIDLLEPEVEKGIVTTNVLECYSVAKKTKSNKLNAKCLKVCVDNLDIMEVDSNWDKWCSENLDLAFDVLTGSRIRVKAPDDQIGVVVRKRHLE